MSSVVKFTAAKKIVRKAGKPVSIAGMLKSLVGEMAYTPTPKDLKLAEEMEDMAEEHNGEYDGDNNSVIFEGKDSSVTVFASTDGNNQAFYQAVHETYKPRIFTAGEPATNFMEALANLKV